MILEKQISARVWAIIFASILFALTASKSEGSVACPLEFAPQEGIVRSFEQPYRQELCLNGLWQFQPVAPPPGYQRGSGKAPELPLPTKEGWETTPIKIPSPWNVNTWGCGRHVGPGTDRSFWPDSIYFPSYPDSWDHAEMGWLRRSFRIPSDWAGRRIVLHFEAVAGDCQVLVNGQPAGNHFDSYLPFDLDITRLVSLERENELLVGVRAHSLFNKQSQRYPKMHRPYPCGSATERLAGIWQDVFLLGLPPVRVEDVFVKPFVDRDLLEFDLTLRNDGQREQTVTVSGEIIAWKSNASAFSLRAEDIKIPAGASAKLTLREQPNGRLEAWKPGSPHLYAAVLAVKQTGQVVDSHFTRFGWRQFSIRGSDLLLNGQPIQLTGDFLHPFGPFILSRSYVRAWYQLIQDFGGNSVRPHAQPHPRQSLDLADEMGLIVLDETAIFGSSIALNFEEPVAWERFASHYDGLVLRDRNHPSVLGWSFGNELFAIFDHNNVPKDVADTWYRQLADLGARARALDPTRDWISCDGDEDLRGALPVWSKHFGHGTPLDRLPEIKKPLMIGESGGTYYARPKQMAEFNGERAFESYEGRNEALAIDVYDNIIRMARPRLAYYSASETAWFGVEHLNFGYHDFTRLPDKNDGVYFSRPYVEGKPGIQPERLPPFVATLNPGWDPALPLYKPLAMFHAQKAALAKDSPQPGSWSQRKPTPPPDSAPPPTIEKVGFVGDIQGPLARRLASLGMPMVTGPQSSFTIIDGSSPHAVTQAGSIEGTILALVTDADSTSLNALNCSLTDRAATALVPDRSHPWTASFTLPDLYFGEDGPERFIQRHGIAGPGRVLLRASDTDWSLFNEAPEHAKCAAVLLGERLLKPSGAALVETSGAQGRLLLCSLDWRVSSPATNIFWRRLFTNAGIRLGQPSAIAKAAFDENGVLLNALSIGRFPSSNLESALGTDFIGEAGNRGTQAPPGYQWRAVNCPSRDRFVLHQLQQPGASSGAFAVYFSCWLNSPRALDDLLAGGPDAPRLDAFCYASEQCRLFLNGREVTIARLEPADYRTRVAFERLPLQKGWNQLLVKIASTQLTGEHPATLAVRITSNNRDYFRQIESGVVRP